MGSTDMATPVHIAKPAVEGVRTGPGRFEPSECEVARSGRTPAYHGGM